MLKNLFIYSISLVLILTVSCKEKSKSDSLKKEKLEKEEIVEKDNYKIVLNDSACVKSDRDILVVFFESDFNDDLIELVFNDSIITEKIKTDETLGVSKRISLGSNENIKKFYFKINGGDPVYLEHIECNFVFVNYNKNDVVTVDFSNKFIPYN